MKKLVLKISGEAIKGTNKLFNFEYLDLIILNIKKLVKKDYKILLIIGGGNIVRGADISNEIDHDHADFIGMQATNINAYLLWTYFNKKGLKANILSNLSINNLIEQISNDNILKMTSNLIILGGGTGRPGISTDSGAVEAAIKFKYNEIWFGKNNIDGIYTDNPLKNKAATKIDNLTYKQYISKKLKVIDLKAIKKIIDKDIVSYVFNINNPNNISNFQDTGNYSKISR